MYDLRSRRSWENDDAVQFRDSLRRFLATEAVPRDPTWREQKRVDRDFWRQAGELGFLCPSLPVEYGGSDTNFSFEAVIEEELGYAGITSFGHAVHGPIAAHYILRYGTPEQCLRWLPGMASGELIGAIGMTEPGGGSDLQAIRTTARRTGDRYVINGSKTFITNGQNADVIVLAVKTDPSQGARGVSMIVLETNDLAGFRRGRNLHKIGMHGSDTAELFFDDVRVPIGNLLGEEGQGFIQMMESLPQERLAIALGAQATMERAIEITVEYVNERQAFRQTLMDFQNTRFQLAECLSNACVNRAFIDQCVTQHVSGGLSTVDASIAKAWSTDRQCEVLDKCLQLHGGYGFMEEYPIARMYADARVQRIYGGANEIMKELIARALR
ncbi:acyl-CoA dehydrogenase family protein [Paraburkholderia ferrariae]|uniref:acyl-CoA dehydrogenase family protein n=1 Tax=Paraburkholderia ferrariae TaxID=386056 RepID=UPI0005A813FD|nr:acyl-CoA dehydrogenase family protein [Paraburkholderia ferrariae]